MMNLAALGALAPPGIYELLRDLFKLMPRKLWVFGIWLWRIPELVTLLRIFFDQSRSFPRPTGYL